MGADKKNIRQIGIDIGGIGIRVVVLQGTTGLPQLVTYGSVAIDPKIASSDSPADLSKISSHLRQLVTELKIAGVSVVAGLSASEGFASVVEIPQIPAKEVGKALELQADKFFPTSIEDSNYDWQIIENAPVSNPNNMKIFIASAPKKVSERMANLVEGAGLKIDAIEVNPLAVTRSLASDQVNDGSALVIVDVGHNTTEVTLVQGRAPLFVRTVSSGMSTFIRSAAQNLNIDEAQAEQFVRKFGVVKTKLEGQVYRSIKAPVDNILSDVDRALKYFSTQNAGTKVDKIIVTGNGAIVPDLPLSLANTLNMPVEIGNPWKAISYTPTLQDDLISLSPTFAVAAGLAQRGLLL